MACTKPFKLPAAPASASTILWNSAYISGYSVYTGGAPGFGGFGAGITLSVNGLPESTAIVTMTGPGFSSSPPYGVVATVSVPLTYVGPVTVSGNPYAFYSYSQFYSGAISILTTPVTTLAYQAGQTYSLTTVTSAGTASVTEVAPGGFGGGTSSAGSTVTWGVEGNADQVFVAGGGVTTFTTTGDANSPVFIPASARTGTLQSRVEICQQVVSNIPGAAPGSFFYISQSDSSISW